MPILSSALCEFLVTISLHASMRRLQFAWLTFFPTYRHVMISQRICRSAFVEAVTISLARHSVMFAVCLGRNRSRCPGFMEGFGIFVLFPCNARVSSSHLLHLACTHYEPSSSITRCTSRALIMSHHPLPHAAPRVHSL